MRKPVTYKQAGVDIHSADIFKRKIKSIAAGSQVKGVLKGIGGFGSLFDISRQPFREPVLVSSADGVGTKLKVAIIAGKHDTVGIDAVAMNVNDILCTGARTLFFLDYIAYSKLEERFLLDIVRGLTEGCRQADCCLIGGETAQMPDMYKPGEYDLAGFCVGAAEKGKIIDGSRIEAGNMIIGLESSGLHSNGYSLVRKVFSPAELKRMAVQLLAPTRIYVRQVLSILARANAGRDCGVRGISHITGGAFYDKISRILPRDIDAVVYKNGWKVPDIFRLIQAKGNVPEKEMYHTLNMGVGMVLIVERQAVDAVLADCASMKLKAWKIGETVKGAKKVELL
jgi:phosphoribosylformylglycinamidine cyclo-ligase